MASWNQKELRGLVEARDDSSIDIDFAKNLMYSIDWKVKAKKYHLEAFRKAPKPLKGGTDSDVSRVLDGLINRASKNFHEYSQALYVKEFNLIAAAQAVHSLPEIILQLACLLDHKCEFNIHQLRLDKSLKDLSLKGVRESLQEIIESELYKYLNAFTNRVKHISLVKSSFDVSLVDDNHELVFKAFKYKKMSYPSKVESIFVQELDCLTSDLIKACAQLNEDFKEIGK